MATKSKPPTSKRTPELWDMVTREGLDGLYQITAINTERQTCTLTLFRAGYATNLEHFRIALATLTCVKK